MSNLLAPEAAPVEAAAAMSLILLLAWALAAGAAHIGKALTDAVLFVNGKAIKKIPVVGKYLYKVVEAVGYAAADQIGKIAVKSDQQVGRYYHSLAKSMGGVFDEIAAVSLFGLYTAWYITKKVAIATFAGTQKQYGQAIRQAKAQARAQAKVQAAQARTLAHPAKSPVDALIRTRTKTVEGEVANLRDWTVPRVGRLEHAIDTTIPGEIGRIGAAERTLAGGFGRVWNRVKALDRKTIGIGAAALVATALGRLGLGWTRCYNVKNIGRRLCGLDPSIVEDLLVGTVLIVGTISIVDFAKELQGIAGEAEAGIRGFIRETR